MNPTVTCRMRCCSRIRTQAHGSLFQWHQSFVNQASQLLASDAPFAVLMGTLH